VLLELAIFVGQRDELSSYRQVVVPQAETNRAAQGHRSQKNYEPGMVRRTRRDDAPAMGLILERRSYAIASKAEVT